MIVNDLATFVQQVEFELLSESAKKQLKIRLLDSLGTRADLERLKFNPFEPYVILKNVEGYSKVPLHF